MMKRFFWFSVFIFSVGAGVACAQAQESDPIPDLVAQDIEVIDGVGDFGQPTQIAHGTLVNNSDTAAYTNISLAASIFNDDGERIGEGSGVAVNACGAGLLLDFALQPGHSHAFEIPIEIFEQGEEIDRIEVASLADPIEARPVIELTDGIQQIAADQEVVAVEWIDNRSLRFGVGCSRDLFSTWDWYQYRLTTSATTSSPRAIAHPYAELVTPELMTALLLEDPEIFNRSALSFAPNGDRLIYQDAINTFLSAGFQGQARRTLYSLLSRRSLQGVYWLPDENFLAYYFGAYGDPVYYFTANAEARAISPFLENNPPSVTIPGASLDGRRVVVGGTFDDVTGYFLYVVTNNFFEPLFEADLPGNNYPAPIPLANPDDDLIYRVYVAVDVDEEPHVMCFNRLESELYDLAPLPFDLADDERARWWISPDETKIALAVEGSAGGLWLIDLAALPACEAG
jgi:hypothetical protein